MKCLHLLHWNPEGIVACKHKIKDTGYDTVMIHTMQPIKAEVKTSGDSWLYYQTLSHRVENPVKLKWMCDELHKIGLKVMCDFVGRNMAGDDKIVLKPNELCDKELLGNPECWAEPIEITDYNDRKQLVNQCSGMPLLNVYNEFVQEKILAGMRELYSCGVDIIRLDQLMHFPMLSEGCDILQKMVSEFGHDKLSGEFVFTDDEKIQNEYSKFAFPIIHWWECKIDKDKVIVMDESHDSFLSEQLNKFSENWTDEERLTRFANICKEFKNVIYYARPSDHWYINGEYKWLGDDKTIFCNRMRDILHSF